MSLKRFLTLIFCFFSIFMGQLTWALTIISPHRLSMKQEFVPLFEEYYKKTYGKSIKVEWLDQGGASDDHRYILSKFNGSKNSAGIDIFWGGGEQPMMDLADRGLLQAYNLPSLLDKAIPKNLNGFTLREKNNFWFATALSTFGIFYNKKILKVLKLSEPKVWEDLIKPEYFGQISFADLRHASSSITMCQIMIDAYGWKNGWRILTQIAANTHKFTHSSSDPVKHVVSGETPIGLSIEYYVHAKILELGFENLAIAIPEGKTIINADPIGILKGAPNLKEAQAFIDFILSEPAQRILLLAKGAPGGPKFSTLARMPILPKIYDDLSKTSIHGLINPFKLTSPPLHFDMVKNAKVGPVMIDIISAILIDNHTQLKALWKQAISQKKEQKLIASGLLDLNEDEEKILNHTQNWSNSIYRAKVMNEWSQFAKERFNAKILDKIGK